jgi:hypothetical protein
MLGNSIQLEINFHLLWCFLQHLKHNKVFDFLPQVICCGKYACGVKEGFNPILASPFLELLKCFCALLYEKRIVEVIQRIASFARKNAQRRCGATHIRHTYRVCLLVQT